VYILLDCVTIPSNYKQMIIDVVLLTYTKNDYFFDMTNKCINSIINSEKNYSFNIKLIETDKTFKYFYDFDCLNTIVPEEEFNYNKFVNIGLKQCKNEWILVSNNDTEYTEGWLTEMLNQYSKNNSILSMSPYCPTWGKHKNNFNKGKDVYIGHRASFELAGWSILMNRKVIDRIGYLDEQFDFWYQDNDYGMNLRKYSIKHALIRNAIVHHGVSKSHELLEKDRKYNMTDGSIGRFKRKWSK